MVKNRQWWNVLHFLRPFWAQCKRKKYIQCYQDLASICSELWQFWKTGVKWKILIAKFFYGKKLTGQTWTNITSLEIFFDFFIGLLLDRVKCQLQFANSSDGAIIIVQERGKYGLVLQIFTDIGLLCLDQRPGILHNTSRSTWVLH